MRGSPLPCTVQLPASGASYPHQTPPRLACTCLHASLTSQPATLPPELLTTTIPYQQPNRHTPTHTSPTHSPDSPHPFHPQGGTLLVELFATPVAPGRARFLSVTGGGPPPPRPPGPPSLKSLPFIASAMWVQQCWVL